MKIKLQIKNRFTGILLFEYEKEDNTIKDTLLAAIKVGANLRDADLRYANLSDANLRGAYLRDANLGGANLCGADLGGANLCDANLCDANLRGANLRGANLCGADLCGADLSDANLSDANLSPIKHDMWAILLPAIPEISNLKKAIIEGKIDGSTYDGECACLCGTIEKTAIENIKKITHERRDGSRPIERFFTGIEKGDTPETSQFSKLALEWIEEFESYINPTH